jgi:hypothetical protein
MAVSFLPTAGITQYLPTSMQEKVSVPELSYKTKELFQSIQPKLSNDESFKDIRSLDNYVTDLTDTAKALEEGKKRETLHKVLSILSLAALIGAIAGVTLLCVFVAPAAPFLFFLPAALFIAAVGSGALHENIEKFRTNKEQPFDYNGEWMMLSTISLGFSIPIHYMYAAFNRRAHLEAELKTLAEQAKSDNTNMENYIRANSEMLQTSLERKLQVSEHDLAKLKELKSPLKNQENELSIKIDDLKLALRELEALRILYI